MKSAFCLIFLTLLFSSLGLAQDRSQDDQPHIVPKNLPQAPDEAQPPPPNPQGESSSKDSEIKPDVSGQPPVSAAKQPASSEIQEMKPFDPHKAAKDLEVGQYYLKHKNYRAALDRFNEALLFKPNDSEATFYLAQTQEELELYALAYKNYGSYSTIFKEGPHLKDAQDAMKRIEPHLPKPDGAGELSSLLAQGEDRLAKNDYESAHESFVKALQVAPDDPVANFRVAQTLQGLERLEEARIFYKKYLSLDPNGKLAGEAKRAIGDINFVVGKG